MVTLIRHAESTFNASGSQERNCGITENGKKNAAMLEGEYDLVICSTLKRSRQTLDHSKIRYGNVIFSELCREIRDGNPVNLFPLERQYVETTEDIKERIDEFNELLRDLSKEFKNIAVISHHTFLQKLSGYSFGNCHIWKFYDP